MLIDSFVSTPISLDRPNVAKTYALTDMQTMHESLSWP